MNQPLCHVKEATVFKSIIIQPMGIVLGARPIEPTNRIIRVFFFFAFFCAMLFNKAE